MSSGRRGGQSGARQKNRSAKYGALMEARKDGCRCMNPRVELVEIHEGGMREFKIHHNVGCPIKKREKDRGESPAESVSSGGSEDQQSSTPRNPKRRFFRSRGSS